MSGKKTVLIAREVTIAATYRQDGVGKMIIKHPCFVGGKIFSEKENGIWESDCGQYILQLNE